MTSSEALAGLCGVLPSWLVDCAGVGVTLEPLSRGANDEQHRSWSRVMEGHWTVLASDDPEAPTDGSCLGL